MRVLPALFTFILSSSIASGFPVDGGSEEILTTFTAVPSVTSTLGSVHTDEHNITEGQKHSLSGYSAPQENTISSESDFFASLKGYVNGEKFSYEKYLQNIHKLQTQWVAVGGHGSHSYVATVFGDMTDTAKAIVRLFNHENQGASSAMRNMYQFYVSLLFSYKADKTVDGDVSSAAYKQKISDLWDTFKEVRTLPRGPLWDLRDENVELDIKITLVIRDLEKRFRNRPLIFF